MNIDWISQTCPTPDSNAATQAAKHQGTLTKPAGSLGRLETLAINFAAWQGTVKPALNDVCIRIFAADHGVCAQSVSAFPQEVTVQMIQNFVSGGAAISVLAKRLNADFSVVNMGTTQPTTKQARLRNVQLAKGTADFTQTSAMSQNLLARALNAGREEITRCDLFIGGEMGIGNTTSASAIYAALLDLEASAAVGPGTGIDHTAQQRKAHIIEQALNLHTPSLTSPLGILQCLGGFEIAALTGAYIASAQAQIPILVDGFICTAAALLATRINPGTRAWMLFAHHSSEPAHWRALETLKATPILNLDMGLGEGSGAAVAVPIIQTALALHAHMSTFESAGVSDKHV